MSNGTRKRAFSVKTKQSEKQQLSEKKFAIIKTSGQGLYCLLHSICGKYKEGLGFHDDQSEKNAGIIKKMAIDDIKSVFAGTNNDSKDKIINEYYHLMINDGHKQHTILADSGAKYEDKKNAIMSYINTIKNYFPLTWAKYCAQSMERDIVMVTDSDSITYPSSNDSGFMSTSIKKDPIYVYYDGRCHFSRVLTNKKDDMGIYGKIQPEHIIGYYDPKLRSLLDMQTQVYDAIGREIKQGRHEKNIEYLNKISNITQIIAGAHSLVFDNILSGDDKNNQTYLNKIEARHQKWITQIENKIIELIVVNSNSSKGISTFLGQTKIDQSVIVDRIQTMLLPTNIDAYGINKNKQVFLNQYIQLNNISNQHSRDTNKLSADQQNIQSQEYLLERYNKLLEKNIELEQKNIELKNIAQAQAVIIEQLRQENLKLAKKNRTLNNNTKPFKQF